MDSNNSNSNTSTPSDTSSKYQDILDQYSKQIAATPDTEEEDGVGNTDDILKTITVENNTQAPPTPPSSPTPAVTSTPLQHTAETFQPIQRTEPIPVTVVPQTEEPKIPADNSVIPLATSTGPSEAVTKESNFFKILFFISLLIFLVVTSFLALSFINSSKTASGTVSPAIPTITEPTNAPEEEAFCFLNDNKYKMNETFPSADGCNTCTCGLDGTISCTEKACNE